MASRRATAEDRETVWLWHVTHRDNLASIDNNGLLIGKSQGAPRVWLCEGIRLAWAFGHVAGHHKWAFEDLAFFLVGVPADYPHLKRQRSGIWWAFADIPAHYLDRAKGGQFLWNEFRGGA